MRAFFWGVILFEVLWVSAHLLAPASEQEGFDNPSHMARWIKARQFLTISMLSRGTYVLPPYAPDLLPVPDRVLRGQSAGARLQQVAHVSARGHAHRKVIHGRR